VIPRFDDLYNEKLPDFEKELIDIMVDEKCTMSQALGYAFSAYNVDTNSVFDLVDFLEERVYDLDKVQAMMMIYTGRIQDFQLTRLDDGEAKTKRSDKG
jgi:hypothetical protein